MLPRDPPVPAAPSHRALRKEAARRILRAWEPAEVERWAGEEPLAASLLQVLLYDGEDLLEWRAAEALGLFAAVRGRRDPEAPRELLRRTLWLMNDESGGLLWRGPEVMGAVLAAVPGLCGEFLAVLASFLEEEPFRVGVRWGLWRVAAVRPREVEAFAGPLAGSRHDPDPSVRGHAALALAAAAGPGAATGFGGDPAEFHFFDHRCRELRRATVAQAAGGGP
jgi:hypothetical protein